MQLQFLGANRQVTGSRYCLEWNGSRVLVDCGMFQEREYLGRNWLPSPVEPNGIQAVLLTHAHLDHCGLLPRLVHAGFRGPILATAATAEPMAKWKPPRDLPRGSVRKRGGRCAYRSINR